MKTTTMATQPVTVGTFTAHGKQRFLRVMQNDSGTWTAGGPSEMRDFARRGDAVRWLKRVYARPGLAVTWYE